MSTNTSADTLWRSDDVARFLGLDSVRTLDRWAYLGTGPRYARIGKHRRYDPSDVVAWVESKKTEATT